jgi:hypothetical protein
MENVPKRRALSNKSLAFANWRSTTTLNVGRLRNVARDLPLRCRQLEAKGALLYEKRSM